MVLLQRGGLEYMRRLRYLYSTPPWNSVICNTKYYKQEYIHISSLHKLSCYPQSLGEDETSLKGQELHETAQKSFLKACLWSWSSGAAYRARSHTRMLPFAYGKSICPNTDKTNGSARNGADYRTTKAKQQLNKCCCPGALGAEPRINESTSKPLTSSISLQTPHQPTHPTEQPTSGTKALRSSPRLFINSLFVCLWHPPLQSLIWFLPPKMRGKINLCRRRSTAKHHPQVTILGNEEADLANPKTEAD